MPSDDAYTIETALHEANELLDKEFGDSDQGAAVQLATFLYSTAHMRDKFLKSERDEFAYGGGKPETP